MKKYIALLCSLVIVMVASSCALATSLGTLRLSGNFEDGYVGDRYNTVSKFGTVEFNYSMYHITARIEVTRGKLPTGLELRQWSDHLYLYGEAAEAGVFDFDITVSGTSTSGYGNTYNSSTTSFRVTILPNPNIQSPSISGTFPDGTVGRLYSHSVYASDGVAPYSWSWTEKDLPKGLSLKYDSGTLTLSGQPKETDNYRFTVTLRDSYSNRVEKTFTVNITGTNSNPNINNGTTGQTQNETSDTSGSSGGGGGGCNSFGSICIMLLALIALRKS